MDEDTSHLFFHQHTKGITMEFQEFVRRPFKVEAIRITEENIDEVAALIGEVKVHTKTKDKFILLDKRIVPSMTRAFVGWWVTRYNDNLRVYSNKIFLEQFTVCDEGWVTWFELADEADETEPDAPKVTVDESKLVDV